MPKRTVPVLRPPREMQRQEKGNSSRPLQPKREPKREVRTRPGGGTGQQAGSAGPQNSSSSQERPPPPLGALSSLLLSGRTSPCSKCPSGHPHGAQGGKAYVPRPLGAARGPCVSGA